MLEIYKLFICILILLPRENVKALDHDRPKYVNPRVHPVLINFSLGMFKKKQIRPHL